MKSLTVLALLAVLLIVGGVVVGSGLTGADRPTRAAAASDSVGVPSWIAPAVKGFALAAGEANPTNVVAVLTTRQRAVALTRGWVRSNQSTYFVVLQGKFADTHAHTPDGRTIFGTVMTLDFDAATQGVLDYGLGHTVPPIAELGPVTDITDQL